ncbi:MAG: CoA transferase [Alicyclobacillus macrosporangiidus]|uniref:CaiB/BaiF CoA transferase family protein n=1 Tax=Alicyclobacillus macrosporangiidus TaxID=392015 RepID=UPI0026F2F71A|nr:CoA transferase [Alicyclobacillus macrosporangiidus]MCL6599176.1 CoA transferase [Alicyclobacillus macrosporangiidus]
MEQRAWLKGVKVLDFTQILSGPMATMVLADAGADVVKVEKPGIGDTTRRWGPPFVQGESLYFAAFNRGKRSIALDLNTREDLELAKRLAMRADVVVENLRPGTLDHFGLGAAHLRSERPELIYVSITGYRAGSSRSGDPALEVILEAETGLMDITGTEDGRHVRLGVAAIDMMTGVAAAARIFGALYFRAVHGQGETISVSLEETAAFMMTHPWMMFLHGHQRYEKCGTGHPNIAPYEDFQTADLPIIVAAVDDQQFQRLCTVLDRPEWASDPSWRTNAGRVLNRHELHRNIEDILMARPAHHWVKELQKAKISVGVVNPVHIAARQWLDGNTPKLTSEHPRMGTLWWPTSAWNQLGGNVAPPPLLDADRERVISEWLGT